MLIMQDHINNYQLVMVTKPI